MAIVVEDGSGKADAESYVSVEEADVYFQKHLYPGAWETAESEDKEAALVMATRAIDAGVEFKGSQVSIQQALEWPRVGVTLPWDGSSTTTVISGYENVRDGAPLEFPANEIPKKLRDAVCELCRFIMAKDRDTAADTPEIKRQKLDVIEREFFQGGRPDILPEAVVRLLRVLTVSAPNQDGPASAQAVRLQRG